MAKNITRHLSHLKSTGTTGPEAADLIYGEIAVGYGKNSEALYIKNSNNEIVAFSSDTAVIAEAVAVASLESDEKIITNVTSDTEISVTLSEASNTGRTLTITHASGSTQSGFKKLSSDAYGHITGGSAVELSDLTSLGALSGVSGENGITASTKADGSQTIGHTNNIAAGTAQGSNGEIAFGGTIDIPSVTYDANGHITASGKTTVTLPSESAKFITAVTESNEGIEAAVAGQVLTIGHENTIAAASAKTSSTSVTATPTGADINIPTISFDGNGHINAVGSENVSLKVNAASTSVAGVVQLVAVTGNGETTVMTQKAVSDELVTKALASSAITNAEYDSTDKKIYFKNASGSQVDFIDATDFIKDGMVSNVEIKEVAESGSCLVVTFNTDSGKDAINIPLTSIFDPSNYYTKSQTSGATELSDEFALYYKKTETSSATEINDAFAENELVISTALNDLNTRLSAHTDDSGIHVTAADKANWNGKVDNTVTVTGTNGLTGGGALTGNVTISHATAFAETGQTTPNAAQTAEFGGTVNVPIVKYDTYGHITAVTSTTITMPSSAATWDDNDNDYITGGSVTTAASEATLVLNGTGSAGASITIPSATTTSAGLLSAADKDKLDKAVTAATVVSVSQTVTSGTELAKITVDSTDYSIYANEKTLTVKGGTNNTAAVAYTPGADATLTVSGAADSGIGVSGSTNTLTIGLGDIVCGDYA